MTAATATGQAARPSPPVRIFEEWAPRYRAAGWRWVLALPAGQKAWPPRGFTGHQRVAPSGADMAAMTDWRPRGNLALGAETGVQHGGRTWDAVFVDVDHYRKGGIEKRGGDTIALIERAAGVAFPPTWQITSRGPGVSGKFGYLVEAGTVLADALPGIEIVSPTHRYAVAPPSTNPHSGGSVFVWRSGAAPVPDRVGAIALPGTIPAPADMAVLPPEIVAVLRDGRPDRVAPLDVDQAAARAWFAALPPEPVCAVVRTRYRAAVADLQPGRTGRFVATRGHVLALMRYGERGHHGVARALDELEKRYVAARAERHGAGTARGEFDRMTRRPEAVGRLLATPTPDEQAVCTCAEGLLALLLRGDDHPAALAREYGITPPAALLGQVAHPTTRAWFAARLEAWT